MDGGGIEAHIGCMRNAFILAPVLLALVGCAKWDEARERAACEQSNPGDRAKADECYAMNKLAYDRGVSWAIRNHGLR